MAKNWSKIRLGDICQTNKSTYSLSENWDYVNYLDTGNLTQDKVSDYQHIVLGQDKLPSRARRKVEVDDILYSTVRPNQLHYGIAKKLLPNTLVSTGFAVITVDKEKANSDFIYYYLTQNDVTETLQAIGEQSTSAYPSIKPSDIENLEISLPTLEEQEVIAHTLRSLDQKIEVNREINHHLAEMAESIWKEKYANLKPNSTLGNFFPIITGKKDANVARGGQYPFFSCSQGISYTDAYSFEGNAILLAGNGDFNVKTYNGKFEAYQRTYVLIPNNEYRLGFLYYAIKHFLSDITAGDRGSVIKYITKGDIENLNLYMPDDESDFELFNQFVSNTAQNNAEIERLTETRDTLLPKLMSGELSVID